MRKKTTFRTLLLAVICLLTSVQVKAQYSGEVSQYPTTDYSASNFEFPLSVVAAALDTDAETLAAAITAYITAENPDPILFYSVVDGADQPWDAATEAENHGFWMDATGNPVGWGDNARFYASPRVDTDNDVFAFYCGQMPGTMQAGDVATATLKLKFNGKEATFALTLNVIAKPTFDVPEPMLIEKQLTIVGEQEKVVEQFPRGGYDSDAVEVDIQEALALLGITNKEGMAENIGKVLYTTWYNSGDVEQGGGMKKDSLTNVPTAGGHGFWFRPVDNAQGEKDGEVAAAGWGDVDRFFIENFTYNAENGLLTAYLGQYPGSCKENETYFAYVYIIYGEKAYRIKYTLKLGEKEAGNGLADYTKVGEGAATVEQSPTDDFSTSQVNIDVEAIAAALGCEVSALGVYVLDDKDNFGGSTANNGGWWLNDAGTVVAWGAGSVFFIEPPTANDWSVVNVGQYPNTLTVGDEVSATLNFVNGTNYYPYTITLKIVNAQTQEQNFENVATRTFVLQSLVDNSYTPMDLVTIAAEDIEAAIGTTSPVFYGLAPDSLAAQTGEVYSKKWSCDPKPGFWLAKDGRVSKWGGESPVGICWVDNSILRFFQYPNANSVGDTFTTQLFLVNEETNKMITINVSLSFVETLEQKEVVGQENLLLPVTVDGKDIEIDLSKAAEALGVTVADLLSSENYYLRGMKNGVYGEAANAENGLAFSADGGFDAYGSIYFSIAKSGDKAVLNIGSNDEVAADYSVDGQFCFEIGNKQYVYYVKFLSEALYQDLVQGISSVKAAINDGNIYDLQGRQVKAAKKGLYIQNGHKVVIK
jgi:hypothetical protein